MNMPSFESLVPHRGAMMLLDRVISANAESLCAEVAIRPDSLFCGPSGVGAWVGVEYMAQAIGAYAGYRARLRGEPVKVGFLLGLRQYESSRAVFLPGDVLRIHVRRVFEDENGLGSFDCHIDQAGERIATAQVTVFQPANVAEFLQGGAA